jgi:hypothetical protein
MAARLPVVPANSELEQKLLRLIALVLHENVNLRPQHRRLGGPCLECHGFRFAGRQRR